MLQHCWDVVNPGRLADKSIVKTERGNMILSGLECLRIRGGVWWTEGLNLDDDAGGWDRGEKRENRRDEKSERKQQAWDDDDDDGDPLIHGKRWPFS